VPAVCVSRTVRLFGENADGAFWQPKAEFDRDSEFVVF